MRISYAVARQIADHAAAAAPEEACGLLAGQAGRISLALPVKNIASAPASQFQLDPQEQLRALKAIDAKGFELQGIYHSHPNSAPIPSAEDIRCATEESLLQLIVSLQGTKPQLKLWRIADGAVNPVALIYDTGFTPRRDGALKPAQQAALIAVGIASLLILLVIALALLPAAPKI